MGTWVDWTEITKGKKRVKTGDICFRSITGLDGEYVSGKYVCPPLPDFVCYHVKARTGKEETEFWLGFLKKLFLPRSWKYRKTLSGLTVTLRTKRLKKHTMLMQLTAFRCLDEFPEVVNEFYKSKDESDPEKLLHELVRIHHAKRDTLGMSGHGLMYYYFTDKDKLPNHATIAQVHQRLKANKLEGVHKYFEP